MNNRRTTDDYIYPEWSTKTLNQWTNCNGPNHIAPSVSANMLSQYENGAHKEPWLTTDHTMTHSCDCLIRHVIILKLIIEGVKNIFILKGFNDDAHEDRLILPYRCDVISPEVFESNIATVSLIEYWNLNYHSSQREHSL